MDEQQQSIREHIDKLIRDDNKVEFVSFLANHGSLVSDFSPSYLFKLICTHRAVGCATSLLEQNSPFCMDVHVPLDGGFSPLQLAAQSLSFGLTSLLLEHGAQPNLCDEIGTRDLAMLPLNMALKAVSDEWGIYWSPKKSVFKLLYILCLPALKEPLNTIKLLAERTEDVEKVALYCVEEGEVVQLAALLMGAWSRLVPPNADNLENSLVGHHIWRQIADIFNQDILLMIMRGPDCEELERLKSKKINLLAEWKCLKALEIARNVIEDYRKSYEFMNAQNFEVPYNVASKIEVRTGLMLEPDDVISDDIECLRPKLTTKEKALVDGAIEKQMRLWSMLPQPKTRDGDELQASHQKELSVRAMVSSETEGPPGRGCCSLLSSMSFCSSRPYHTWGDVRINLGKTIKIQVPSPPFSGFPPSAKICARLLLCAKRSIK